MCVCVCAKFQDAINLYALTHKTKQKKKMFWDLKCQIEMYQIHLEELQSDSFSECEQTNQIAETCS